LKSRFQVGLKFMGADKGLILNKTNTKIVIEQLGDDMDGWPLQTITLLPGTAKMDGKDVGSIKVEGKKPEIVTDDEVPFK